MTHKEMFEQMKKDHEDSILRAKAMLDETLRDQLFEKQSDRIKQLEYIVKQKESEKFVLNEGYKAMFQKYIDMEIKVKEAETLLKIQAAQNDIVKKKDSVDIKRMARFGLRAWMGFW